MELAKKFLFKLDSKSVKALKDKNFVCYDTDTIKLVIEIIENDDYKDLYNSNIEVIFSYPNGESLPIKQTMGDGGITIEDDSLLSIIPKSGCLIPTDYMRVDINIYDEDEFITLQPFIFKIYKSKESEIFEDAQDVVKTMRTINEQVKVLKTEVESLTTRVENASINMNDRLELILQEATDKINGAKTEVDNAINNLNSQIDVAINNVNTQTSEAILNGENRINDLSNQIDVAINNVNTQTSEAILNGENRINDLVSASDSKLQIFLNDSTEKVNDLMKKIDDANVELDEVFLRSTPLTPIDNGEKILFRTETLLTSPTNLVNKSYILTTSGSPYVSTVITSNIGFLYFTLENGNVVINYSPIANKSVQGNSISVVPQFDNGKTSIKSSASEYKIYVLTNLLISCVDNATCTITSNTTLSNNI